MKKIRLFTVLFTFFMFSSCATKVNYTVIRPAELDMNGANTISVLTFKPSRRNDIYIKPPRRGERRDIFDYFYSILELKSEEAEVIRYIDKQLKDGLSKSKYLSLVDSDEVENALRRGYAGKVVDVYLTGEIVNMDIEDERIITKKTIESDEKGPKHEESTGPKGESVGPKKKTVVDEIKFKRHVYLDYIYEIIDAETDEVISYKQVEIRRSSAENSNPKNLPDAFDIIKYELDSNIKKILKSVQPYSVERSITLMESKSAKEAFEAGDNLIKIGKYSDAANYYYKLYERQGIFEAGYNAALLYEAVGRFSDAEDLMLELCMKAQTSKQLRKAKWALNDIRYEENQSKRLENQLEEQAERWEK